MILTKDARPGRKVIAETKFGPMPGVVQRKGRSMHLATILPENSDDAARAAAAAYHEQHYGKLERYVEVRVQLPDRKAVHSFTAKGGRIEKLTLVPRSKEEKKREKREREALKKLGV